MRTVTLIIPILNEEEGLEDFHSRVRRVEFPPEVRIRILFVDDGSTDNTLSILERLVSIDIETSFLRLSRNFGQQAALCAGLDVVDSDAAVVMDGDGQHPPELIPRMIQLWLEGAEVVRTQKTATASSASWLNRLLGAAFYRLSSMLSEVEMIPSGPEFCLLSRPAVEAVRQYRESHRFLRGLVALLGFPTQTISFTPDRRDAGQTKYSIRKLIRLASDGLFSFSTTPLYFSIGLGGVFLCVAFVELSILLASFVFRGMSPTPGWTSLMIVTAGGFGTTMVLLGIIGIYVGKIFEQVKQRPIYLVERSSSGTTSLDNLSRSLQSATTSLSRVHRESDSRHSVIVD